MKKIFAALCVSLFFCACAGSGASTVAKETSQNQGGFWVTLPARGSLVIIGASGRQSKSEAEIELAREDAARKAAMYHRVWASVENTQNIGPHSLNYYTDYEINLDYDRDLAKYAEALTFNSSRDVLRVDGGVFVRFSYPSSFPAGISYGFARGADGSPEWVKNPPDEIGGFLTGVGFSGRQFYFRDTFEKSCNAAVAALASRVSTSVTVDMTSDGGWNSLVSYQRSAALLDHFLVLEIWVDPKNQSVWTLAIARKAQ
jgi:hypothetical protein